MSTASLPHLDSDGFTEELAKNAYPHARRKGHESPPNGGKFTKPERLLTVQ